MFSQQNWVDKLAVRIFSQCIFSYFATIVTTEIYFWSNDQKIIYAVSLKV